MNISIDEAHANLLFGLVCASKPERILEFGIGAGTSADAILRAVVFNDNSPSYTLVDNGNDEGSQQIAAVYADRIKIENAHESDFVKQCVAAECKFDFIFSDADHNHTHEWFTEVYDLLLMSPGILIYHDATNPEFPNFGAIHEQIQSRNLPNFIFNQNSRPGERCDRGLLVIFKNKQIPRA